MQLGIPVAVWSSSAARPLGAAPTTCTPLARWISWSVRRAVVLPEPATPTTQTTRSRLSAASRTSRCCSRDSSLSTQASEHGSPVGGRRADVAAGGRKRERLPFDLEQLPGREPCRPARNVARLDLLDAGKRERARRRPRAPAQPQRRPRSEPATARTSSGCVNVVCVAVSPSAASRSRASSSRSGDRRPEPGLVDEPA